MKIFFTIDGVEDSQFPPNHPKTIKFFDRESAESLMNLYKDLNMIPQDAFVGEHEVK